MQTINGTFIQNLPIVEGDSNRGHWLRGGFVIEFGEDYPRKLAFSSFGEDKVATHRNIPTGTPVQVRFSPESREYNGRWYTELRCISVLPLVQTAYPQYSMIFGNKSPCFCFYSIQDQQCYRQQICLLFLQLDQQCYRQQI